MDIKQGMGLEEILNADHDPDVYGSLVSSAIGDIEKSLNLGTSSELTDFFDLLVNSADSDQGLIADAIVAKLAEHTETINTQIQSDLTAQQAARDTADAQSLIGSLSDDSPIVKLVASDALKSALSK